MAHLHNIHKNQSPSLLHSIGQKVKVAAEIAGALKTIYSVGKPIVQAAAPIVAGLL